MDKSRHYNRLDQFRKRTAAKRRRARRWALVPQRLIFVSVAAAGVLAFLSAIQQSDRQPETSLSNLTRPSPPSITGIASIVDGDTIEIHGQRIRLNGIDAPESKQYCNDAKGLDYPCGRRSAEALDAFLATSRPVSCRFVSWDRYDRFVGECLRSDGANLSAWMVEHGQALDWPRYSHGAYAQQQSKAEAMKIGIWAGKFQAPWEWRAEHADGPAPSSPTTQGFVSRRLLAQTGYSCQPRRTCSQISSCDEANWYLANCSWGGKLDRDKDGIPCETVC
ncbi:thermonuclease family protein [Mesorhizobium sp. WSM3626]|uniref:thermonuclease family protein n=1 Tax=Mesorhizobium sp. WSM3626 TaxID=1040987 RepID=UPI000686BB74|nr:thermonuclease family protein [Mesorhizobium sp. WSM3626]